MNSWKYNGFKNIDLKFIIHLMYSLLTNDRLKDLLEENNYDSLRNTRTRRDLEWRIS